MSLRITVRVLNVSLAFDAAPEVTTASIDADLLTESEFISIAKSNGGAAIFRKSALVSIEALPDESAEPIEAWGFCFDDGSFPKLFPTSEITERKRCEAVYASRTPGSVSPLRRYLLSQVEV